MLSFAFGRYRLAAFLLSTLFVATPSNAQLAGVDTQALASFAQRSGLEDLRGFVDTVKSLRETGQLPSRYVTKDDARSHGWRGGGLCSVWPGHVIGGDDFHNAGQKLPVNRGRRYREADLDSTCRSRGAKRLIYANDGPLFITTDHYNSFTPVP